MATTNVFLGSGSSAPGFTDGAYFGTGTGTEAVNFAATGVANTTIDQNVENVTFGGSSDAYQFSRSGNLLRVFSGATLVTTIVIQDDANGTQITFADGIATAVIDAGVIELNGAPVPTTQGPVVIPGLDGGGPTPGDEIFLTVAVDRFVNGDAGGADDDTYVADIVQNPLGEQTNTLGTGDRINGGGGIDTLEAHVQDASPLNAGPTSAINPITTDVEIAHFTAEANYEISDVEVDSYLGVEINAARMNGLDEVGSVQSDSSLTIYNLTTLTDSGSYADRRVTESITVRMDHTGNDSAVLPEANLTVLFDQDYLLSAPPGEANSSLTLQLLDIDNEINSGQPLLTNPFDTLVFGLTIDGIRTGYQITYDGSNTMTGLAAYQALADSINDALEAEGLTDLVAAVSTAFGVVDPDGDPGGPAEGFNITITNMGEGTLDAEGFIASGIVPANTDYQKEVFPTPPDETPEFITVDVALEKVGKGADGGALTIGGMGTDLDNVLVGDDDVLGVEQFDVTVSGDDTQDSSLSSVQSTDNFLRFVYVESAEGTDADDAADLIIGNSNTVETENGPLFNIGGAGANIFDVTTFRNNALKDVVTFDTTGGNSQGVGAFLGDVTVHAYFSQELREKYLDQTDTDPDPDADLVVANYTTGVGDDTVNLAINQLNFTSQGTVTRDDFFVNVSTGAGEDHVQIQIGDGENVVRDATDDALPAVDAWYHNHVITDNMTINTGADDDFVETWGSTAARITLGAGDDLIYSDNSGENEGIKPNFEFTDDIAEAYHATWVFNARNDELSDLESELALTFTTVANVVVTVTYLGIELTVDVGDTRGPNGGTITDLTINQAIKDAINSEGSPFEGLIVAEDGPARTLIVRSLTDGQRYVNDLTVDILSQPLSAAQSAAGADLIQGDVNYAALTGRYDEDFGSYFGSTMDGNASSAINNDRIEGGTGGDTIVLSSNGDSVQHVVINAPFSTDENHDIVLNFEAAVELATENEVQTFTIDLEDDVVGDGTLQLTIFGFDVEVPFEDGQTEATVLDNVEAAIEAAITAGDIPGTLVRTGNEFEITADATDGTNYPSPDFAIIEGGTPEVQSVLFEGTVSEGQVVSITFGSLPAASYTVLAGDDLADLVNGLQASLAAQGVIVDNADPDDLVDVTVVAGPPQTATITLTNSVGGDIGPAVVTIQTTGTNLLDATVTEDTPGDDAGFTITTAEIDGDIAQLAGWDIFDLTGVLSPGFSEAATLIENFWNDIADGNEAAVLGNVARYDLTDRSVAIINEVIAGELGAGATEEARLETYLKTIDTVGGSGTVANSVVITVDETDTNLGRFYLVKNGAAVGDADVQYLGTVELGDHADPGLPAPIGALDNIGEWGLLDIENFEPLSPEQIATNTFQIG